MPGFNGQLNQNEVIGALYNMIISEQVFADNFGKHQTLVEKAKEESGLFGDTKLFIGVDALKSQPWLNDAEASNLLALHRPEAPKYQKLVIDQFRMIPVTIDNYMTKRAFMTEGSFSQFNGVVVGMLRETKRAYEGTLYNTYCGTTIAADQNVNEVSVDVTTAVGSATGVEKNRLEGMAIAERIADLLVELGDYSRDYNGFKFLRSYSEDTLKVIWNSKWISKLKKADMPTIYHKEGLVDKLEEEVIPARYFGRPIGASDIGEGKVVGADGAYDSTKGILRASREFDYNDVHYFAGDALATTGTYVGVVGGLDVKDVYLEEADVICKVCGKLPAMLSGFETGTNFFNPRSLTETHYLIWGYSEPEYIKQYPFITVKAI